MHDTTTPEGLKAARTIDLGLTQKALGAAIGMHWTSIARMEAGDQLIELRVALAVECLLRRVSSPR